MSHADAHGEKRPWYLAHHFDDIATQNHAMRLGMWLFLSTEVLLFAGLFMGYTVYRWLYPTAFQAASRLLSINMGGINTVVLLISSFFVAWGYHAIKHGESRKGAALFGLTILCACIFLVVKYFEYAHKFHEGQLPGKFYTFEGLQVPGANIYFAIYFLMTGLHGLHVLIGMSVLGYQMVRTLQGRYSPEFYVSVELGALYWHLVDLVWIFLFPLLYLI